MEPVSLRRVADMLACSTQGQLTLCLDGVTVRGEGEKSDECYIGRLFLLQAGQALGVKKGPVNGRMASVPSLAMLFSEDVTPCENVVSSKEPTDDDFFLVWAPYSFLSLYVPGIDLGSSSFSLDSTDANRPEPPEWMYIVCVPVKKIAKVQRCSNRHAMSVIKLFFLDGTIGRSLTLQNGGMTRFLDALGRIAPLRQSPAYAHDFIVYGDYDKEVLKALATSNAGTNGRKNSDRNSFAMSESGGRQGGAWQLAKHSPKGPMHSYNTPSTLYKPERSEKISHFFATTATKISNVFSTNILNKFDRDRHGRYGSSEALCSSQMALEAADEESFELVDEILPLESQIPRIPHPEGRAMRAPLTKEGWEKCFVGEDRRIDPDLYAQARAIAYTGGVEKNIRLQVWCFVLGLYPDVHHSTEADRQAVRATYEQMYERLTVQWTSIFPEQERQFSAFRDMRSSIEKDVVRTDRVYEIYTNPDGVKLCMLRNVLMAHVMFNFDLGYCQGMSDVLSPIVVLSETEAEAFMCFRCFLAERCADNFCQDVREGMRQQLNALQSLVRHFVPRLYTHLQSQRADEMSFCFRWLLMLFKREFSLDDTMLLWDVILCCPYTTQFEIFIAAALLKALAPQILGQHLTHDELIKFANSVAGRLDVRHVILLAQEFYDDVARRVMECSGTSVGVTYPLTLNNILRILEDYSK